MAGDDALTATRLDVAEMKGMLQQALSDHGRRISDAESHIQQLHMRVNDRSKSITAHEERIAGHDEAITELKAANNSRSTRIIAVLSIIAAGIGLAIAILNSVAIQ